jgi:hypothetical protein
VGELVIPIANVGFIFLWRRLTKITH